MTIPWENVTARDMDDLYVLRDLDFYRGSKYYVPEDELVERIRSWRATLDKEGQGKVDAWIKRQQEIGFADRAAQARINRVLAKAAVSSAAQ